MRTVNFLSWSLGLLLPIATGDLKIEFAIRLFLTLIESEYPVDAINFLLASPVDLFPYSECFALSFCFKFEARC